MPPPDRKFSSDHRADLGHGALDVAARLRRLGQGRVLFVGESGTAKTTRRRLLPAVARPRQDTSLGINFSSRTSSIDVQTAIEDSIEKRTKDVFGPPAGKRLLVFVDDLNMPRVDTYGTQQPIALLKLVIDKGFLYDRGKDLTIKYIKDMQFIAAMVPRAQPRRPALRAALQRLLHHVPARVVHPAHLQHHLGGVLQRGRLRQEPAGRRARGEDHVGGDVHLQRHRRRPAADARKVPLHLQPARPLAHHRGRDAARPPTSSPRASTSSGCSATRRCASSATASSATRTASSSPARSPR